MAIQTQPVEEESRPPRQAADLGAQGLKPSGRVHWNLTATSLLESAIKRGEGVIADMGAFVAITAPHTGRSPNDKFVVKDATSESDVDWGKVNQPYSTEKFELLLSDLRAYLDVQPELFVQDLYCGADPKYRL